MGKINDQLYQREYAPGPALDLRIEYNHCVASIQERYFGVSDPSLLFCRCIFYLDFYDKLVIDSDFVKSEYMRFMQVEHVTLSSLPSQNRRKSDQITSIFSITPYKILNRSGTIIDRLCGQVSHIIVPRNIPGARLQAISEILNYSKSSYTQRPYLITQDWIDECIKSGTMQNEHGFKPN